MDIRLIQKLIGIATFVAMGFGCGGPQVTHSPSDVKEASVQAPNVVLNSAPSLPATSNPQAVEAVEAVSQALEAPLGDPFLLLDSPERRGEKDLVIVAVGDVSQPASQWVEQTEALKGKAFDPTRHLINGDLNFMNLENPMTSLKPSAKKTYAFTSPPARLDWYLGAGFNLFSLANNHIADADQPGIDDTIANLQAYAEKNNQTVYHAGAGKTPEQGLGPVYFTPEGKDLKIAFFALGFSRSPNVGKFWDEALLGKIREAKTQADIVLVSVHAGKEYIHVPAADIQTRYRSWVDAGADLVIGHHTHCIQPVEQYKSGLILYSLGNYVFGSRTVRHRKMGAKLYGMMARIVIHKSKVHGAQLVPLWVNNSDDWVLKTGEHLPNANFAPTVLTGPFADAWFDDFDTWTKQAGGTPIDRVGDIGFIRMMDQSDSVAFRW